MHYFIDSFWWGWEDGRANIRILSTTQRAGHIIMCFGEAEAGRAPRLASWPPAQLLVLTLQRQR